MLNDVSMTFYPNEAVVLSGPSGSGKSTLLRMIYGGYRTDSGKILVRHNNKEVDLAGAKASTIHEIRKETIGYVGHQMSAAPGISALEAVTDPLIKRKVSRKKAEAKSRDLLERLNLPEPLWHLPVNRFSSGEQQRVHLATGFIVPYPILLLDEPVAGLADVDRKVVFELIQESVSRGACVLSVLQNTSDKKQISGRNVDLDEPATWEIDAH